MTVIVKLCKRQTGEEMGGGSASERPPSVKALIIMWAALDSITLLFDRPGARPGLLAGCGKVNGGGKTSYCVTLERNGEGQPSVSSGLPYPQSKWTRAARGEATDTHRAKPSEHNVQPWTLLQPKRRGLGTTKTYIDTHEIGPSPRNLAQGRVCLCVFVF